MESEIHTDYDGAWKEALERYFEEFVAFASPIAYAEIDWEQGYKFLDKELQQISPESETGQRRADKLVKVWRRDGGEAWVLVHVEVQSQEEAAFAERMYVYNYRIFDRYRRRVASLAVLGDERPTWRPSRYERELWGCRTVFEFPVVKLADYRERWEELEGSDNPFAVVVMAHLKSQETRHDEEGRKAWKFALIRRLYERGYEKEDVRKLFRFIDWLMRLPDEAEQELWEKVRQYEEVKQMPYVTSVERIGFKKGFQEGKTFGFQEGKTLGFQEGKTLGLREGILDGVELVLRWRFGEEGMRLMPKLRRIEDVERLRHIKDLLTAPDTTLDGLRHAIAAYRPDDRRADAPAQ